METGSIIAIFVVIVVVVIVVVVSVIWNTHPKNESKTCASGQFDIDCAKALVGAMWNSDKWGSVTWSSTVLTFNTPTKATVQTTETWPDQPPLVSTSIFANLASVYPTLAKNNYEWTLQSYEMKSPAGVFSNKWTDAETPMVVIDTYTSTIRTT